MPLEIRLNYISLSIFAETLPEFKQYSLEDINFNTNIRNELREKCHERLFTDFMDYLEEELPAGHILTLEELKRYYTGAGFNHTNENKFQHLEGLLWKIGYFVEDTHVKDPQTLEKKKVSYVLRLPALQELDQFYRKQIGECLEGELEKLGEDEQVLESALRRTLYSLHEKNTIPLHIYLRAKGKTLQ